jgi:FkbM family methyltransferase
MAGSTPFGAQHSRTGSARIPLAARVAPSVARWAGADVRGSPRVADPGHAADCGRVESSDFDPALREAVLWQERGDSLRALEAYRRAFEEDPTRRAVCVGLASALSRWTREEYARLAGACRALLHQHPDDAALWTAAGLLALELGELATAEMAVRRAAALDPRQSLAVDLCQRFDRYRATLPAGQPELPSFAQPQRLAMHAWARAKSIARRAWPLIEFALWRLRSQVLHGERRWLRIYGRVRVCVRAADFRAYRMWKLGGTQPEKVALWRALAERRPALCVDAGANYGEFTLSIADLGLPVLAVEANPEVARCLGESIGGHPNVTLERCALASADGETTFHFAPHETGGGSIAPLELARANDATRFLGRVQCVLLPARRLDGLVSRHVNGAPLDSLLLKLDIEGGEPEVLASVRGLLDGCRWWRAIVEFNAPALRRGGTDPRAFWQELRSFPGVVVGAETVRGELSTLKARLPAAMPDYCDVLIGRGELPR